MDIRGPVKDTTTSAKQSIDSTAAQLQDVANSTLRDAKAVGTNLQGAIDDSLSEQPYTTLGLAVLAGFVLGAIWKS